MKVNIVLWRVKKNDGKEYVSADGRMMSDGLSQQKMTAGLWVVLDVEIYEGGCDRETSRPVD